MAGQKGMGDVKPRQVTVTVEGVGSGRSGLAIRMEIDRFLDRNPKFAPVPSIPTKSGTVATRRFPLPPDVE